LLAEAGYDQLTIDAVAGRAQCSKATIYRRWPRKAALVITAVRQLAGQPAAADRDDFDGPRVQPDSRGLQQCDLGRSWCVAWFVVTYSTLARTGTPVDAGRRRFVKRID
jgi:AcrR family transcriptional regulator